MKISIECLVIFLTLQIGILGASFAQTLSIVEENFISNNAVSIEVNDEYKNGNWAPVLEKVKGKKLLLLGEFNHGSKEVFVTRNELIKAIHEQIGIGLILFESGLGEVGAVNLMRNDLDDSSLTNGFFEGWRTKEFENLLQFAKENNIAIGGFDIQRTGSTFTAYFSKSLSDPTSFGKLEEQFIAARNRLSNSKAVYDLVKEEIHEVINQYRNIHDNLGKAERFEIQTMNNRIGYLTYMLEFCKSKNWNKRWAARDSAMTENIRWYLSQNQPKGMTVIIAHNFHISRYNEKEEVMGEYLTKNFDRDMYVVGVFAEQGAFHNNSGKVENLSEPDSTHLDIKHIIKADKVKVSFVNIPDEVTEGDRWLFQDITVNDTFIDLSISNKLNLSRCFDGLLLLDKVSPPEK